jgi:hypothetical protein
MVTPQDPVHRKGLRFEITLCYLVRRRTHE